MTRSLKTLLWSICLLKIPHRIHQWMAASVWRFVFKQPFRYTCGLLRITENAQLSGNILHLKNQLKLEINEMKKQFSPLVQPFILSLDGNYETTEKLKWSRAELGHWYFRKAPLVILMCHQDWKTMTWRLQKWCLLCHHQDQTIT